MYCNVGVITFISEERRNTRCSTRSIVKSKLDQWKESFPVILLVVAVHTQILFQSLICSFSLPIAFRVISGSEVKLHIQSLSERSEEVGNELGSTVGRDMSGNSVLGKHMDYEELGKLCGRDSVVGCNENSLLRKSIYNYQY